MVGRFVTRELEEIWDFYEGVYSFEFYLRISECQKISRMSLVH